MSGFNVTARRSGDSVQFELDAEDIHTALADARKEARVIFAYRDGEPNPPTVAVKPAKEE